MTTIIGGLVQMRAESSVQNNVAKAEYFIREAASKGATIVALQELFNTIYFCYEMNDQHFALAEPLDGPTILKIRELARQLGISILAPFFEKGLDGCYYNTAPLIGPSGQIQSVYRKSHIPLVNDPTMTGLEKFYFTPGQTGFVTAKTGHVHVGTLICYDRHFPEGSRSLALAGAQLMFVPTATSGMTKYLWDIELRAHAVDNVMFVAGINRVGVDSGGGGNKFYGSSMWVNPRGEIIAQASETEEEIVTAELDLNQIQAIRAQWGFFRDRRPDLYRKIVE